MFVNSNIDFIDSVPYDSIVFIFFVLSAISEIGGVLHLYKMLSASSVSFNMFSTSFLSFDGFSVKHFSLPMYVRACFDNISNIFGYSNFSK